MKPNQLFQLGFCILLLSSCGTSLSEKYKLNKKYWNVDDYKSVLYKIKYVDTEEKKPNYADLEKAVILKKLIDRNYWYPT